MAQTGGYSLIPVRFQSSEVHVPKPIAYCAACLVQILMAQSSDDRRRLETLRDRWKAVGSFKQSEGLCTRCGYLGEVSYSATVNDGAEL